MTKLVGWSCVLLVVIVAVSALDFRGAKGEYHNRLVQFAQALANEPSSIRRWTWTVNGTPWWSSVSPPNNNANRTCILVKRALSFDSSRGFGKRALQFGGATGFGKRSVAPGGSDEK